MKYVSALSSISQRLDKPFKDLMIEDIKAYVARLEANTYRVVMAFLVKLGYWVIK
jgi:hypothetical protein